MIRSISLLFAAVALATPLALAAPPVHVPPKPVPSKPVPSSRASASASPAPSPSGGAAFDLGVWTVHASSVDANFKTGDFSTPDKVVMTRAGGDVTADRANGNYKKQLVYLNGHVVMHDTTGSFGGVVAPGSAHASGGPSTLTADKAQIEGSAKTYKAIGNVHYVQSDTVVDADNGTLNDMTHDLFLQGSVHISQGKRNMTAESVLYNTVSGNAHAEGNVTLQFPGELHRTLATPKPVGVRIPKNRFVQPVTAPSASP